MQTPPDPFRGSGGAVFARGCCALLRLAVCEDPAPLANELERLMARQLRCQQTNAMFGRPILYGVNRSCEYARSAGCVRACTSCSRATETRV